MTAEAPKQTAMELLRELRDRVEALEKWKAGVVAAFGGGARSAGTGEVADDEDLDSQWGDPFLRKNIPEKYWKGHPLQGFKFSQLTPEALDAVARYKDACAYANEKAGDPAKAKYIAYDRRDAARARGWALRFRNDPNWVPPAPPSKPESPFANGTSKASPFAEPNSDAPFADDTADDSEIPF